MSKDAFTLRSAMAPDMAVLGGLTARSWRHTFAGLLPEDVLSSLTPEAQQRRHERLFARAGVHYRVAAADDGRILGFASYGPCRDPRHAQHREVYALYIEPGFTRRGIGSRLFDAVRTGAGGFYLTALALNPNLAFYRRHGGIEVAAPDIRLGDTCYRQIGFLWP